MLGGIVHQQITRSCHRLVQSIKTTIARPLHIQRTGTIGVPRIADMNSSKIGCTVQIGSTVQKRNLFIEIEPTPNPDSMKFVPHDQEVLPPEYGSGRHFSSAREATGSPVVRELFKIPFVTSVFLAREYVTINKDEKADWEGLRTMIFHCLLDHFSTGAPLLIEEDPTQNTSSVQPEDSEIVATIKELLEERIRPAVQEDGGDIFFAGFDEATGIVKVRMAGSCVGCPSSSMTLRNGVENMLKHYLPEVQSIQQVDENPNTDIDTDAMDGLSGHEQRQELKRRRQQALTSFKSKLASSGVFE